MKGTKQIGLKGGFFNKPRKQASKGHPSQPPKKSTSIEVNPYEKSGSQPQKLKDPQESIFS